MTTTIETPGIWTPTRDQYHADHAKVSASSLKVFSRSIPEYHARHVASPPLIPPIDPTPEMILGTAVHLGLFEPAKFLSEVAVMPDFGDGRTKAAKDAKGDWLATNGTKPITMKADHGTALYGMLQSLRADRHVAAILDKEGKSELAIQWSDEATGLPCKALLDRVSVPMGMVIDLKTTDDVSPEAFARKIASMGYHLQAAHYCTGAAAFFGKPFSFLFIAVGREPPHEVVTYMLSARALEKGREERAALIRELSERIYAGDWASRWTRENDIPTIDLPRWQYTKGNDPWQQ